LSVFVPRSQFHPNPDSYGGYYLGMQRQPYLVQHHTPGQAPTTLDEAYEELAQIYHSHTKVNGWGDYGYNFLIWDQYIFEGRGFGRTGAHAPGANSISIGVAFLLDGRYRIPTPTEYAAFHDLAKAAIEYGYLHATFNLTGHREWVSTNCPGDECWAHLNDFWIGWDSDIQLPPAPSHKEISMYDFELRQGLATTGADGWHHEHIHYDRGAVCYDFHDVMEKDRIVVSLREEVDRPVAVNLFYPSAKQTEAKELRFGRPVKFSSEEAGFVTLMTENDMAGKIRVTGERSFD